MCKHMPMTLYNDHVYEWYGMLNRVDWASASQLQYSRRQMLFLANQEATMNHGKQL